MRWKALTDFHRDHLVEPRPSLRTLQGWPGAKKIGGRWYIDMDIWQPVEPIQALAEQLLQDEDVARLVG